ncbi:tRNA (guanosine(37)-N1)-methyltransferase TrmD [Proteinivorax hydrogeniformans]|uniref:tRNA (guanine-N(1)-)-methyltransferase n=1 Tax=Proteinivorax hydrogeniformans TaxID=1826727 RepID=A0AAU8HQU4_9FIRM
MIVDVITIFPEMFESPFSQSIIKRAITEEHIQLNIHDLRKYSRDKHNKVDDYPYGGGAGMVMKPEPFFRAIEDIGYDKETEIVLMTPTGQQFQQQLCHKLLQKKHMIILCGHYEGIDQRVIDQFVTREISIGDYVLTGGELPAMVVIDAITRVIPGVLPKQESYLNDSFQNGLLEHPHYTRPMEFRGLKVPDVLLSGNHAEIDKWRHNQSVRITKKKRPDLLGFKTNN